MFEQLLGKRIIHENLEDLTVLQANKQAFASRSTADNFDVADDGVEDPFSFSVALEVVAAAGERWC